MPARYKRVHRRHVYYFIGNSCEVINNDVQLTERNISENDTLTMWDWRSLKKVCDTNVLVDFWTLQAGKKGVSCG